ncbi:MAG TPA: DUF3267 domain-containing protein [Niallia sp.]|nr:DUF3267 domain-containing protein [Niallia sp.]
MKILNRMPKSDDDLHKDLLKNGWTYLKEPKNCIQAILLSSPFMIIAVIISIWIINITSSLSLREFGFGSDSITIAININSIVWLVILLLIHEVLHLIFIPKFIHSPKTYIGLTVFGGYVMTEEELTKSRYLLITLAPFLIISIISPILLSLFGMLNTTLKFLILLNSMGSAVDILTFLLIMKQVPNHAIIKSNGPNTYWKIHK